jgi:hypothetical protein
MVIFLNSRLCFPSIPQTHSWALAIMLSTIAYSRRLEIHACIKFKPIWDFYILFNCLSINIIFWHHTVRVSFHAFCHWLPLALLILIINSGFPVHVITVAVASSTEGWSCMIFTQSSLQFHLEPTSDVAHSLWKVSYLWMVSMAFEIKKALVTVGISVCMTDNKGRAVIIGHCLSSNTDCNLALCMTVI